MDQGAVLEFRAEQHEGRTHVKGYVVKYGDVATVAGRQEKFIPGSLSLHTYVRANQMHNRQQLLGLSGKNLALELRADGLYADLTIPQTALGNDTIALINDGVLNGFSAEFLALSSGIEDRTRIVRRARVYGVGLVDVPAYDESEFEVDHRAQQAGEIIRNLKWWVM